MYKRYFGLPLEGVRHLRKPVKRCYINRNRLLEEVILDEMTYILRNSSQSVCLYSPREYREVENKIEKQFGNKKCRISQFDFSRNSLGHHNYFFHLKDSSDLHYFHIIIDEILPEHKIRSDNMHIFVDMTLLKYESFMYSKHEIRSFRSFMKRREFDVIKPADMDIRDERARKHIYLDGYEVDDIDPRKDFRFRLSVASDPLVSTHQLIDFEVGSAQYRNNHLIQEFKYF